MNTLFVIAGIFFVTFMMIVFRGAPYVPTKQRDIEALFEGGAGRENGVFVDLGSGDGRAVLAAAQRGIRAIGYELNPFLVAIAWWRLRNHRSLGEVRLRDFWLSTLPDETSLVFVFLATPYMKKLDTLLAQHVAQHKKPITLASYGVAVPGKKPQRINGSMLFYDYKP